jgi:plastocyanin
VPEFNLPEVNLPETAEPVGFLQGGPIKVLLAALAFLIPITVAIVIVFSISGGNSQNVSTGDGKVWSYQIPNGTKERIDKGLLTEDYFPEQLTIAVGDTVEIVNQDVAVHSVGPFTVRPGETQKMIFVDPGYYFGACTVGVHKTVTITVV